MQDTKSTTITGAKWKSKLKYNITKSIYSVVCGGGITDITYNIINCYNLFTKEHNF